MTQFLPPNLLALFAPRDPIPFVTPNDKPTYEKKRNTYTGVSSLLAEFEDPEDTPPPTRSETKDERKERKRKEKAEQAAYKLEQDLALWGPGTDGKVDGDPYRTLFIARINFDTSESKLRREFEVYGPVKKVTLIHNILNGKPRGYAFVEYEHERDMHSAYKRGDGKKIDGRRVLLDVERGRTIKGWRPRRLGGGLGSTRKGGPEENSRYSGRDDNAGRMENRSRSRSAEPPRPRERERERERPRRRSRSRSRDRKRRRSRSKERRRRSRSKERGKDDNKEGIRRRRRSRSKDRKRSRSPRDRKRRRSRSRDRKDKLDRAAPGAEEGPDMAQGDYPPAEDVVKQEPINEAYHKYEKEAPPPPEDTDEYGNGTNGMNDEYGGEEQ